MNNPLKMPTALTPANSLSPKAKRTDGYGGKVKTRIAPRTRGQRGVSVFGSLPSLFIARGLPSYRVPPGNGGSRRAIGRLWSSRTISTIVCGIGALADRLIVQVPYWAVFPGET